MGKIAHEYRHRHSYPATYCIMSQRLTTQQARAVDLLVGGNRIHDVAAALGVDRVTIWRWRQTAEFEAELNSRRHELWQGSIERLRSLVPSALETLALELEGKHKLRAAEVIL